LFAIAPVASLRCVMGFVGISDHDRRNKGITTNLYIVNSEEGAKMQVVRMKVAPDTVAYADGEHHKLIVEFAIPGAPTETIDVKILEDSVHLLAPARDVDFVSALALGWPVKPDKAEATYENGLLRIEVPFKDPMEDAVKVAIKPGGAETKTKSIEA
jgi:HSP20 family protein